MFLKYQTGSFITQPEFANRELINRCLAGCIIHVRKKSNNSVTLYAYFLFLIMCRCLYIFLKIFVFT